MSLTLALRNVGTDIQQEVARTVSYGLPISYDVESTGLNPRTDKLVSVQLKAENKRAVIIDARDMDPHFLQDVLGPIFSDRNNLFRGHNIQFDIQWLMTYMGIPVDKIQARFYDVLLVEYLIMGMGVTEARNAGISMRLDELAGRYGVEVHKEERSWFYKMDQDPDKWNHPFPYEQLNYMRQDVSCLHPIAREQRKLIEQYGLQEVVDLESRVIPATAAMSHYGVSVDTEVWHSVMEPIGRVIQDYEEKLHEALDVPIMQDRHQKYLAKYEPYRAWVQARDEYLENAHRSWGKKKGWGEEKKRITGLFYEQHGKLTSPPAQKDGVNLGSWQQLLSGFRGLGYNVNSVGEEELSVYASTSPVIQLYLDYVSHTTIAKRYGKGFLEKHLLNGKLYAGWFQLGTGTGRFSSRDPNMQQFPDNGPGARLRHALVPSPGYAFIDSDFSNVELRIGAELSGDRFLLEAFATGADVHAHTAVVMFGLDKNPAYLKAIREGESSKHWTDNHNVVLGGKEILISYRQLAKKINYMLLYGGGKRRLAAVLRIPEDDAKALLDIHYRSFKTIMSWIKKQGEALDTTFRLGNKRAYGVTRSGRRRWFTIPTLEVSRNASAEEAMQARDIWRGQMAGIRRQLLNSPIQGLSADISKLAMALWHERYNSDDMHMVLSVHDEFVVEVKNTPELVKKAQEALAECMLEALHYYLKVVDVGEVHPTVERYWNH